MQIWNRIFNLEYSTISHFQIELYQNNSRNKNEKKSNTIKNNQRAMSND